jgi:hypothetical protein
MRRASALSAFLVSSSLILISPPAMAGCEATSTLTQGVGECHQYASDIRDLYSSAADDGYTYDLDPRCKPGDHRVSCEVFATCTTADGAVGNIYIIWRYEDATGARTRVGTACLTATELAGLGMITPAMVRREMQRLAWPTARLEVEPPDGQTLIHFDTNFFTTNTRPTTQTVVLLGQRVTIEAAPVEYTWHFGDGASVTTDSPGAAYPGLDVTHEYVEPGRVSPSVDTTYAGRYRINGDAWQTIPGTLTVAGEPVALRVRSATPHLVGSSA